MKKRCIYCDGSYEEKDNGNICPHCGKENELKKLNDDEIHSINQKCHSRINEGSDLKDNSLCFIIIGIILLIVSAVFLVLSFKYNVKKVRVFKPTSIEFIVFCLTSAVSCFCLIFGITRFVKATKKIKRNKDNLIKR